MKNILLFAAIIASTGVAAQVPTAGLLRQYSFTGNANDESGNNHHGTVYGATLTEDRFGNPNSAYNFDGTSHYIQLPTQDLVGLNVYSFSIWIKASNVPTNYSGVAYSIGANDTNQDQAFAYQPSAALFAGSFNTGNQLPFQSKARSGPMAPNQWVHVVVIRDTIDIKMYVNGSLLPPVADHLTNNQPAAYGLSSRAIIGGRSHLPWDSFFPGAIDDLRHYDRVLSPAEVTALFNESRIGNRIKGNVYLDANANSLRDSLETGVADVILQTDSAGIFKGYSSSNILGDYTSYALGGTYTVTIPQAPLYHTFTPASHSATFIGLGNVDSLNDFGLAPIPNMNDLRITLTNFTAPRPGFDSYYQLTYKNVGTTTLSGDVTFVPDALYSFLSSVPAYSGTPTDTLSWSFANLAPGQQQSILATLNLPATTVLGDTIYNFAMVSPIIGDQTPADNEDSLSEIVIGSYDPNDKAVLPDGDITPQQVADGQPLTYTIRFQNTGTAEAINVFVQDTLSSHLHIPSMEILAVSHPYVFTLKDNAVEWRFNNIMLPDSNTNEPASHGFIKYRLKPKTNLVINDVIENTAYIFFDFNAPIVTNTTSTMVNLVSATYPPLGSNLNVSVYPNPGSGQFTVKLNSAKNTEISTQVINALGQMVLAERNIANDDQFVKELNLSNLSAGIYFLRVSNGNQTQTAKLVIQK